MFTVVIAEQTHLDAIRENPVFLGPFLKSRELGFCQWLPEGETLRDCIPTLEQTVSRRDRWRAVIITTDDGLSRHNPFDLVDYDPPYRELDKAPQAEPKVPKASGKSGEEEYDEVSEVTGKSLDLRLREYLKKLQAAKFSAYEQAARNPLTRLVTALCQPPMVSEGINDAGKDPEFSEYLAEHRKKQELRAGILAGSTLSINLPAEVFCVARRTCDNPLHDIPASWVPHVDLQYSRFGDRNMYFDKMRYFVFDILPRNHQNYNFDYLRFLSSVLILAGNPVESSQARPGIVYKLICENDEDALDRILSGYISKLNATETVVHERIRELKSRVQERLTDQQAAAIFCGNILIPVTPDRELDQTELYADPRFGLSRTCPEEEPNVWHDQVRSSLRALRQFLKQPRRAAKRAADDMRQLTEADMDKALLLNDYQLEDLMEHISDEELQMVSIDTPNLYDISEYESRLKKEDQKVRDVIDTRMSRTATVGLGAVVLLVFLFGFLPGIFHNARNAGTFLMALLVGAASVFAFTLVCWGLLLLLRRILNRGVEGYNGAMAGIHGEIRDGMTEYSTYLSRVCNVMRGFSVLNFRRKNEPADTKEVRVLNKHLVDMETVKAELQDTFGRYLTGRYPTDGADAQPYDYDFSRTVDFPYPMPTGAADAKRILFLEQGNYVTLPVSYIRALTLRREELYDKAPVASD